MRLSLFHSLLTAAFAVSFIAGSGMAQNGTRPNQTLRGPSGAEYPYATVQMEDHASAPDGYWLFYPEGSTDTLDVVLFLHGYGGYNPMIYGAWLRHLVRCGNVVIYPRYQKNLTSPKPDDFEENVVTAIQDAQHYLAELDSVRVRWDRLSAVGHSYGGVIAAGLAMRYEALGIPRPLSIMTVSAGTAWMKGGRFENYRAMPTDTKLVLVVSNDDKTTGDEFSQLVFETAIHSPQRVLLRQYADRSDKPAITAGHNQAYCVDRAFDSGVRNFTAIKALQISETNAVDYHVYWRLFDQLLRCTRQASAGDLLFTRNPDLSYAGSWSDGTPIRALDVVLPTDTTTDDYTNDQ